MTPTASNPSPKETWLSLFDKSIYVFNLSCRYYCTKPIKFGILEPWGVDGCTDELNRINLHGVLLHHFITLGNRYHQDNAQSTCRARPGNLQNAVFKYRLVQVKRMVSGCRLAGEGLRGLDWWLVTERVLNKNTMETSRSTKKIISLNDIPLLISLVTVARTLTLLSPKMNFRVYVDWLVASNMRQPTPGQIYLAVWACYKPRWPVPL